MLISLSDGFFDRHSVFMVYELLEPYGFKDFTVATLSTGSVIIAHGNTIFFMNSTHESLYSSCEAVRAYNTDS
jgi:hypothetical protein